MARIVSKDIFEQGLAIGSTDNQTGTFHFRFKDESFTLRKMQLDEGRPNRCVETFYIPELKFGFVARVDEIRRAMSFEAVCP